MLTGVGWSFCRVSANVIDHMLWHMVAKLNSTNEQHTLKATELLVLVVRIVRTRAELHVEVAHVDGEAGGVVRVHDGDGRAANICKVSSYVRNINRLRHFLQQHHHSPTATSGR